MICLKTKRQWTIVDILDQGQITRISKTTEGQIEGITSIGKVQVVAQTPTSTKLKSGIVRTAAARVMGEMAMVEDAVEGAKVQISGQGAGPHFISLLLLAKTGKLSGEMAKIRHVQTRSSHNTQSKS